MEGRAAAGSRNPLMLAGLVARTSPGERRLPPHGAMLLQGTSSNRDVSESVRPAEHLLREAVGWVQLVVEALGAVAIVVGIVMAVVVWVRHSRDESRSGFHHVRLALARHLVLALEFQLAADVLGTAIAPTWNGIGQLGAIAVIRTALNFFLLREIRELRAERVDSADGERSREASTG